MPLTAKGSKILKAMKKTYGSTKEAKRIFYSMVAEKKLKGVEGKAKPSKPKSKK